MTMLSVFHRRNPCVRFWTMAFTITFVSVCCAQTQQNPPTHEDRIAQDLQLIHTAEQQHLPDDRIGYLWAVLAPEYRKAGNFTASEDAYFRALGLLEGRPAAVRNYATTLDNLSMLYLTYGRLDEAEKYNRSSAKIRGGLGYPLDEARSEQHMAEIDLARHKFKAAADRAAQALEVMERLNDPERSNMISALNALAFTKCSLRDCAKGMEYAQRSLDMARSSYGEESAEAAHSMMAVGFAEWKLGKLNEADETMRSAIRVMKAREGPESRGLLLAISEYRNYLKGVHRDNDAEKIAQELLPQVQKQAPACTTCVSVRSLSNAMR